MSSAPYSTTGKIAQAAGVPIHRVEYAIKARNIPSQGKLGAARIFDAESEARILAELKKIEAIKAASTIRGTSPESDSAAGK